MVRQRSEARTGCPCCTAAWYTASERRSPCDRAQSAGWAGHPSACGGGGNREEAIGTAMVDIAPVVRKSPGKASMLPHRAGSQRTMAPAQGGHRVGSRTDAWTHPGGRRRIMSRPAHSAPALWVEAEPSVWANLTRKLEGWPLQCWGESHMIAEYTETGKGAERRVKYRCKCRVLRLRPACH